MMQLELAAMLDTGALVRDEQQRTAQLYLASLPKARRLQQGRVYTPPHLVDFVLSLAGYDSELELERLRVLDPACGGGAFLVGVALRIADQLRGHGVRLHTARGAHRFLKACERNLIGIDVDRDACDLSREAVRAVACKLVAPQPVPETFFIRNVVEGDFLLGRDADMLGPSTKFDFIVGNPPYVSTTRLSPSAKVRYRARFQTANGRIDLYVLFFERSLELLSARGRLAFITPNKFLTSLSAIPLRNLLRSTASVRKIAEFDSHKVFADAATVPCVTVIDREHDFSSTTYIECLASEDAVEVRRQSLHDLPSDEWHFRAPDVLKLLGRLKAEHRSLASCVTRISAGVATGLDRVFVVPTEHADRLGLERDLRRPAVRGKDVQAGSIRTTGLDVIIPYVSRGSQVPRLVDIERYPATCAYLSDHRKELERRHCVRTWGKRWYDLHDPWSFDIAGASKIIVPDIAFSNRFAVDDNKLCPLHSVYYLIPTKELDIDYLALVLNTDVIECCIRAAAPVVKDGFIRYRKQFLQSLPIPCPSRAQQRVFVQMAQDQESLNRAVAKLFRLTKSDLELMRSFVREIRDNHTLNTGAR